MNRKYKPQQPAKAAESEPTAGDAIEMPAAPATEAPVEQRRDDVKPHLRCPCCWNGLGGKAERRKWQRQVSGPLVQRCYVCDKCGAEWIVDVRVEVVDGIEWVETKTAKVKPGAVKPGDAA